MKPAAHILSHGDLDGMVCAILLLQRLPRETGVTIANDRTLPKELEKLRKATQVPKHVYIADILTTPRSADAVEAAMRELVGRGSSIHWYDHHLSWRNHSLRQCFENVCSTLVVDPEKTTAAALVWKHFLGGDPRTQRWLRLLSEKDKSDDPSIRNHFGLLAALMQPKHYRLTQDTLKVLAFGEPLTKEQQRLITWYYDEHLPCARALAESAEVVQTNGGRRIGWVDLRGRRGHFQLSSLVIEVHGVDLVGIASDKCVLLGTESIDAGVDLSPLHGRHQFESMAFTIVGHRSPVKIMPQGGRVDDVFLKAIRTFVQENL